MSGGRQYPCWSSLPPELISHTADCFLGTSDIDYYMDFHAIYGDWRLAADDPTNILDERFWPSQWIIFLIDYDSTTDVFMNTTTGRFLRKDIPILVKYFQVQSSLVSSFYLFWSFEVDEWRCDKVGVAALVSE
jgi:hypothetical protein